MQRPSTLSRPVRGVQSIDRALSLLGMLAAHHSTGLPMREIVELSGLDRTTAHRILSFLCQEKLVRRDPKRAHYRLSVETMALGMAAMSRAPLIDVCAPVMKTLARKSGDNVFLVVRSGDRSYCLHLEEGVHPVRHFPINVGSTRLLGLGVASIALLAALDATELRDHYRRHEDEYRLQEVSALKLQLWATRTRERGYSHGSAGGVAGIGHRFSFGSCGEAAISIISSKARMPRSRHPQVAALIREEIAAVAEFLVA